jgi:hypothetical protein
LEGDGALRGDLKGDRNGFESVLVASSILRLLAAGVDIMIVLVLFGVSYGSIV